MNLEVSLVSCLTSLEEVKSAWDKGLRAELFESPTTKGIVEFIFDYWLRSDLSSVPTKDAIEHEFPSFEYVEPKEELFWYVEAIQTRYKDMAVISALEDIADSASEPGGADKALQKMSGYAWEITERTTNRVSASDMAQNASERQSRYRERSEFDGSFRGAPTGFAEVDQHFGGIWKGDLVTAAASTGVGKSWFLGNAMVAARRMGFTPYLATLELQREDFEDRLDCIFSDVPFGPLMKGRLTPPESKKLREGHVRLAELGPMHVDHVPLKERTAQGILHRARERGADFLLIDQLSFVLPPRSKYDRDDLKVKDTVETLKYMVSDAKMPTIIAVQFNRDANHKKRGGLGNHSGSVAIEQIADAAFGLNQPIEMKLNNAMELSLLKARRAETSRWLLNWDLKNGCRFSVDQEITEEDD